MKSKQILFGFFLIVCLSFSQVFAHSNEIVETNRNPQSSCEERFVTEAFSPKQFLKFLAAGMVVSCLRGIYNWGANQDHGLSWSFTILAGLSYQFKETLMHLHAIYMNEREKGLTSETDFLKYLSNYKTCRIYTICDGKIVENKPDPYGCKLISDVE